jgi:hypothetical protein
LDLEKERQSTCNTKSRKQKIFHGINYHSVGGGEQSVTRAMVMAISLAVLASTYTIFA